MTKPVDPRSDATSKSPSDDSRNKAQQALQLLSDAGPLLHASLDIGETLQAIARLTIPVLCDYCIVDVVAEGKATRAAAAHGQPAMAETLRRKLAWPPDLQGNAPAVQVIRTGKSLVIPAWGEEQIRAQSRGPEHEAILRALGPRAGMVVPIPGAAGTIGAISLMMSFSGRTPDPALLPVAEELGRRAGLALQNAELHGEAIAARNAAHEQALELEMQASQLQDQASLLEEQQTELESQAEELEQVNEELAQRNEELHEAVEAAASAERWVRTILDGIADPFIVYDREWIYRYANDAALRTMRAGRPDAPIIGQSMWELYPELRGTAIERAMTEARETNAATMYEHHDAERGTWAEVRSYPLPDGSLASIWKDITARKLSEESLRYISRAGELLASTLDYEQTLDSLAKLVVPELADWCTVQVLEDDDQLRQIAIAHKDPAKLVWAEEINRRYPAPMDETNGSLRVIRTGQAEMYRDIPDELLRTGAQDEEHYKLLQEVGFTSALAVPLTHGDETFGVLTLIAAESRRHYGEHELELAKELARRAAVAISHARLYRRTVETREALEQQATELEVQSEELQEAREALVVANEELRQTNDELAEQTAQATNALYAAVEAQRGAEEANRVKSDFLARMSHELRTPLNAIGGYAQLMELGIHGDLTDTQRVDLQRIQRSQRHLLSLINDVLNFAKLEAGHVGYDLAPVPLRTVLEEIDALVAPQLAAKSIRYERDLPDGDVIVTADEEKLRQILVNLLSNAVKFTESGGKVRIWTEVEPNKVCVSVADSGIGIPAEKLESIFEPFVQLARGMANQPEGTGLGLAISRDLARGMGGDLVATSTLGEGSTFRLELPAR